MKKYRVYLDLVPGSLNELIGASSTVVLEAITVKVEASDSFTAAELAIKGVAKALPGHTVKNFQVFEH